MQNWPAADSRMMSAYRAGDLRTEILGQAKRADASLRPYVRETPLLEASWLGRERGTNVLLKDGVPSDSWVVQVSGAMTKKILTLAVADRPSGVVGASTGNHGATVAEAGFMLNIPVHVFVPESMSTSKQSRILNLGKGIAQPITRSRRCPAQKRWGRRALSHHDLMSGRDRLGVSRP